MATKTVFLDTQIFLHYRTIRDIDWCGLCHTENVSIVIAPIVIQELDKKKIDKDPKIKKRAGRAIREISELTEDLPSGVPAVLRKGVELCYYPNEPIEFDAHSLDASHPDDRLIATLLSYNKKNPSIDCMLISEDLGLRLKAKARDITLGRMPESAKLTEEPDPNEQRIRELEEENRQLKLGTPRLCLAFSDKSNAAHYSIEVDTSPPSDLALPSQIKQKHPRLSAPDRDRRYVAIRSFRNAIPVLGDFEKVGNWHERYREKYNENLDKYYAAYVQYYQKESVRRIQERHSIQLDLMLINDGGAPAHDARVIITFPGNLIVNSKNEHPLINYEPSTPQNPLDSLTASLGLDTENLEYDPDVRNRIGQTLLTAFAAEPRASAAANENDLIIERDREKDTIDVSYSVKLLQHGLKYHVPTISIFLSPEILMPFQLTYQIHASNLRTPAQGILHVIIKQV